MNGARSTFMRKGYWLTALAAAVLLPASPGTALAQELEIESVKVAAADSTRKVGERVETNVVVTLDRALPDAEDPDGDTTLTVTVTVGEVTGASGQAEEGEDLRLGNSLVAGSTGTSTATFDVGDRVVMIPLETLSDPDAVDEKFTLSARLSQVTNGETPVNDDGEDVADVTADTEATTAVTYTIDDDETPQYVFDLVGSGSNVRENDGFRVNLYADPARPENEDVNIYVRLESDNSDDAFTPANPATGQAITPAAGTETAPIVLTIPPDNPDGNRTDDTITLMASMFDAGTGQAVDIVGTTLDVTILDVHQLPAAAAITAETKDMGTGGNMVDPEVEEGKKIYLFVTIENKTDDRVSDTEMLTVTPVVSAAQLTDVKVTPAKLTVSRTGKQRTAALTVEAVPDEDVGAEDLMCWTSW